MNARHAKAVRRRILEILYDTYMTDPLKMLTPTDFMEFDLDKHELAVNMHYLMDAKLVEVMLGYNPPLFTSARLNPEGIDLVENQYRFNLRFPEAPGESESATSRIPELLEQLVVELDLAAVGWEDRQALLRDVHYVRDEIARPVDDWRGQVILDVLGWIQSGLKGVEDSPSSLSPLILEIERHLSEAKSQQANR